MNNTVTPPLSAQTSPISTSSSLEEESIDIMQYWRVIKRYKLSISVITLACLIVGVLVALNAVPTYKAETKLIANPVQPNFDTRNQHINSALIFLFYETQYEIIGSRNIAQKAVDKLDLVARYKTEKITQYELAEKKEDNFIQQTKAWFSFNKGHESKLEPTDEALRANLANSIQAGLTIKGGKQSEIINISYEDPDPQFAADIANAIAGAYMEFGLESRLSGAKQTSAWLNDQLQDLKINLKESEDSLQAFQKSQGMVDTSQQENLAATRLSTLTTELTRAQTKRSEIEIRYKQISKRHENGEYISLTSIVTNHSAQNNLITQTLEQEVIKASRKVQELSERYGEKHPKMIAARADLTETKQNVETEISKIVNRTRKEFQAASDYEKELNALIKKEKRDLGSIKNRSFELAHLEREVLNNQKLYESFLVRFQQANVSEQYDASNILIIDTARVPSSPYAPNKPRLIMVFLISGLFLGILFAFLREHMNDTFKTTKDLEKKLKLPLLGIIPCIKDIKNAAAPERQVLTDSRSQFSENVNNIRTGLLFSNIDHPPKAILITSATVMEGKSVLATNLAASLSQLGSTLLLDVDLHNPAIAKYMGIKSTPGITDRALCKELILKEAIIKVGGEGSKLHVIPAGSFSPNPLELLSSDYFKTLLENLKKTFTYIVLDGPPILAVSDAIVVGQLVDSVIVTVKAESTRIQMTQETVKRLHKANVKVMGTVLCQADKTQINDYEYNHK